ncbi:MAG: aspartyl/asparaginyl beta-hydroxylase domain-containing protein [Variovorax sp.]
MTAPGQQWATEGLAPLDRPGLATRLLLRAVAVVEGLNRKHAKLGNPCVYATSDFPWAVELERDWRSIRAELDKVLARRSELPNVQDITTDARSITDDDQWKIFLFTAYGVRSPPNCALCPATWRAVRRIPGLQTAMFSILAPGKHLPPHRGPYNGVLRLHLGLVVPQPRDALGIRIGDALRHWKEGEALVFDDAYEHEAWNHSDGERVVLFVDFVKPLAFPAALLNALLLRVARHTPFLREGSDNLRRWERRFHASATAERAAPQAGSRRSAGAMKRR